MEAANIRSREAQALLNTAMFQDSMEALLEVLSAGEEGDIHRLSGGKPAGAVRLMTLHGAKGLEFPVVILAGVEEDLLPLRQAVEEGSGEEERRLFFVGITRAREDLILTCGGKPSPFARELPPDVALETAAARRRVEARQISIFGDL